MSITYTDPEQVDAYTWRLAWTSSLGDGTTCYVYRDGELFASGPITSVLVRVVTGEYYTWDVIDDLDDAPHYLYPGTMLLAWTETAATDHYRVEEYVNAAWTLRAAVRDTGQGYYTWRTRYLEDDTTHQFRIVPVGTNGNYWQGV